MKRTGTTPILSILTALLWICVYPIMHLQMTAESRNSPRNIAAHIRNPVQPALCAVKCVSTCRSTQDQRNDAAIRPLS
jgi:hypothetical protein